MIRDISIFGEFFDNDFFAYREDADVAWRAQLLGWQCLYTPDAVAWHVRAVTPRNRRALSAAINRHSVKKPLAAPHQEHDRQSLPPFVAAGDSARYGSDRWLSAYRMALPARVLASL